MVNFGIQLYDAWAKDRDGCMEVRSIVADMTRFVIATASNNTEVLDANLRRSPMLQQDVVPLSIEMHAPSASIAYNRLLDATDAEIVIFAHQDVYFPKGWDLLLSRRIAALSAYDPQWALLGAFGIDHDARGLGPVWSTSLGSVVGMVPTGPVAVQSYDEMLIVMRRSAGLRFDEALPNFHLYGTDIVQTARERGLHAYVMPLPLVHNDRYHQQLGQDFSDAYRYMQRKWRARLPLRTPIVKVSWHGLHLTRARWENRTSDRIRRGMALSVDADPRVYAALCGWSDLTAASRCEAGF